MEPKYVPNWIIHPQPKWAVPLSRALPAASERLSISATRSVRALPQNGTPGRASMPRMQNVVGSRNKNPLHPDNLSFQPLFSPLYVSLFGVLFQLLTCVSRP